ncbi:MAG: hypothetical protein GWO22_23575 [Actinobacteria bacterium]|nr:hypothetical protein [Actinomycetota bacterium]
MGLGFGGATMYGGAVVPEASKVGVAFGARVAFARIIRPDLHLGMAVDWWTAERDARALDVRDIVSGLDLWKDFRLTDLLRPFVGVAVGLHSVDASREEVGDGQDPRSEAISGFRVGAGGFAGTALRATSTGAIWLVLEYRYSLASRVSNHEIRGGLRILAPGG